MPRKRFTAEQIISHLREAEVLLAQGKNVAHVCKKIGITEQTYYRWRKEYGGIRTDQAAFAMSIIHNAILNYFRACGVESIAAELRANVLKLNHLLTKLGIFNL